MNNLILFSNIRIDDQLTAIRDSFGNIMYLIQDHKRAYLIDSGFGIGSLRTYVEALTDKPVTVLLTHAHMDHCMGASEFDRVYMNPADDGLYKEHSDPSYRNEIMHIVLGDHFDDYAPLIRPSEPLYYQKLMPGMEFYLRGLTLRIYDAHGHTHGIVAILLVEKRILILGDACSSNTLLIDHNSTDVQEFMERMKQLEKETDGLYDRIFFSHGHMDAAPGYLESAIELSREILDGKHEDIPYQFLDHSLLLSRARDSKFHRLDGGLANIAYKAGKEKI